MYIIPLHAPFVGVLSLVMTFLGSKQLIVDAWKWSAIDKEPCDEIKYNLNSKFLMNNYIDFYWSVLNALHFLSSNPPIFRHFHFSYPLFLSSRNPEKYMSEKAVQGCHLKYASYHDIDPSATKSQNTFTWISFVGDSVLREVFLSAGKLITYFGDMISCVSTQLSFLFLPPAHHI